MKFSFLSSLCCAKHNSIFFSKNVLTVGLLLVTTLDFTSAQEPTQSVGPKHILKLGTRKGKLQVVGSLRVDTALVLPCRKPSDTLSVTGNRLREEGGLHYDSIDKQIYYYDGSHFRRLGRDTSIYTADDSIRNTGNSSDKRTVYLQSKKLVFALGKKNGSNNVGMGRMGIGQPDPHYTLDIATPSFLNIVNTSNGISSNGNTVPNYDSVAVRISHSVSGRQTSYGLLIKELATSNETRGRSAIGFEGGDNISLYSRTPFVKGRIWMQGGPINFESPKLGIDVADRNRHLRTRMVIDSLGQVGLGEEHPTEHLHIAYSGENNMPRNRNLIRVEAPTTGENRYVSESGLWLTEKANNWGWKIIFNASNHEETEVNYSQASNKAAVGDYLSIDRTRGNYDVTDIKDILSHNYQWNTRWRTDTKAIPVIRIAGNVNTNLTSQLRTPMVVIAPYEGVGNQNFQLRVHGAIQAQAFINYSDSILKKDVRDIVGSNGRDLINGLRPVAYHMRNDSVQTRWNYGFIAQEVERVLPDLVSPSDVILFPDLPDTSVKTIKSINYNGLIAPLVANMQLINKEGLHVQAATTALQAKVSSMEAALSQKEAQINVLSEALRVLQEQVQQLLRANANKKEEKLPNPDQSAILK